MRASETIADTGPGPIRATLEYWGAAIKLFKQKEQNDIIRESLRRAGEFWIAVFLPQRFKGGRRPPGYATSKAWEDNKRNLAKRGVIDAPQPTPLVYIGTMRQNVLGKARAEARATKNRAFVLIRMPVGHAIRPKVRQVMRFLFDYEIKRIAEVVEQQLKALLFSEEERNKIPRAEAPPARARPVGQSRQRGAKGQFRRGAA